MAEAALIGVERSRLLDDFFRCTGPVQAGAGDGKLHGRTDLRDCNRAAGQRAKDVSQLGCSKRDDGIRAEGIGRVHCGGVGIPSGGKVNGYDGREMVRQFVFQGCSNAAQRRMKAGAQDRVKK